MGASEVEFAESITVKSRLEAFVGIYSLLMKWICDAYVLWPFDKKFIFELLMHVNTNNYTVKEAFSAYQRLKGYLILTASMMELLETELL